MSSQTKAISCQNLLPCTYHYKRLREQLDRHFLYSISKPPTVRRKNIRTIAVFRSKMAFFNWAWHKVIVLPHPSSLALLYHRLDLSNEVHNVSELPVVLRIQAVKFENTKKVRLSMEIEEKIKI